MTTPFLVLLGFAAWTILTLFGSIDDGGNVIVYLHRIAPLQQTFAFHGA